MIIRLTKNEIHRYVSTALGLNPAGFTLEIDVSDTRASDIITALRTAIREFPLHHTSQKISCIKRFRDLCPRRVEDGVECILGLAECKWAVENVGAAIRNLEATGKIQE